MKSKLIKKIVSYLMVAFTIGVISNTNISASTIQNDNIEKYEIVQNTNEKTNKEKNYGYVINQKKKTWFSMEYVKGYNVVSTTTSKNIAEETWSQFVKNESNGGLSITEETDENEITTVTSEDGIEVKTIEKDRLDEILSSVNESYVINEVSTQLNPETMIEENLSQIYWEVQLGDGLSIKFPKNYGTKEEVLEAIKDGRLTGVRMDGTNPLENNFTPFAFIGDQWDVPLLSAIDTNGVPRAVYCNDGKLMYPPNGSSPQWSNVLDALEGARPYVISNLHLGYPVELEGGLSGAPDERQLGTGGSVWWNMSVHRGNPYLDWSDSRNAGTGGYSAYHENSTAGANMRYLVDKGAYLPDTSIYVNGQNSGEVFVESDLETIDGVQYQVSKWFDVSGASKLMYPVPNSYKVQDNDGNVTNGGNKETISGKSFRIMNADLSDDGEWSTTTSTDIKTAASLFGVIDSGYQSLSYGISDDPVNTPSIKVNWEARTGNVLIPKSHQNTSNQTYPYDFSKYTVEAFNKDGVSVGTTTVEADGFAKFNDLLLGNYTYTETINDNGIVSVKDTGSFTIIPGETVELTSADGLINRPAVGKAKFSKLFNNATQESYPVKYTDYGVNITGGGVNKDYWLSAANYLETDNLLINTQYTYNEIVRGDKGSVKVVSTGTFTLTADGQMIDLTTGKLINEAAYVDLEYTKRDAEWTTPIFKPSTFAIYDYDTTTGVIGNKIAESSTNFLSAKGKFSKILVGYSGNRTIILKELVAPDGYFKDEKGIVIHLTTAQHKQTIEIDYYNVPEHITSLEVIKTNHKNVVMANVPFKLERINGLGGDVLELIETLKTNADGFTRFMNVPSNDQDNNAICYRATELRTEENKYYILDKPFEFCGDKNVKIVKYTAVNEPKQLKAPIHKRAEANPVGITSDGSVWGLYNNKDEVIKEVTIQNNFAEATNLTFENTTPGMYWQELATGNDALEIDPNKYYLDDIDWMNIEDGDTLEIPGNTAENPLINKIKMIGISGFKANEYLQKLLGVQFSIFAEDEVIVKEDTGEEEIVQKKVADLLTNESGEFKSELYPIYLFDSLNLDYLQEIATLEQLVIITKKYEIPTITASDYSKYKNGDYIEMFTETDPLINYNLRLAIGGYKVNEDDEVLPLTEYGVYDQNKNALATVITDENGKFLIENVRFDIFINAEDNLAPYTPVYLREIKTADNTKYELDYIKYQLPNLYGKEKEYQMNDVIWLSTEEKPFVNKYITADGSVHKTDDSGENNIANVPFLFTRTTGEAIEGIETVTDDNRAAILEKYKNLPGQRIQKPEDAKKDSQDQFLLYTDENGKIPFVKELMYFGEWTVDEMEAAEGYQDLKDVALDVKQIKFTIDKEFKTIDLHFYNTKKAIVLAVTGSNRETLLLLLGFGVMWLSGLVAAYSLWLRRNNPRKPKKTVLGVFLALLLAVTVSGMFGQVYTVQATTALPSISDKIDINERAESIVPNKVDPVQPGDPIKGTDPIDDPEDSKEGIEGEKPTAPEPTIAVGGTTTDISESDVSSESETGWSTLVNAGENTLLYAVIGVYTLIFGVFLYMVSKFIKKNTLKSRE